MSPYSNSIPPISWHYGTRKLGLSAKRMKVPDTHPVPSLCLFLASTALVVPHTPVSLHTLPYLLVFVVKCKHICSLAPTNDLQSEAIAHLLFFHPFLC